MNTGRTTPFYLAKPKEYLLPVIQWEQQKMFGVLFYLRASLLIRVSILKTIAVDLPYISTGSESADSPLLDVEVWLYYAILYKGLEHLWTLPSAGGLEPIPCRDQGTSVMWNFYRKVEKIVTRHFWNPLSNQPIVYYLLSYFLSSCKCVCIFLNNLRLN